MATAHTGIGASTRSSISFVNDSSVTSGSATAWMPWKFIDIATRPGTRIVANAPAGAVVVIAFAAPIVGST